MELVALLLGIALPWATGALALGVAFNRSLAAAGAGTGLLATGVGLFLGLALTTWLLRLGEAWTGAFSWWFVMGGLALLGAAAAWLARRPTVAPGHPGHGGITGDPEAKWPVFLVLLGALVHGGFSLLELATQPVFPWDGWTVWVYRAKAWFFAGQLVPVVDPQQWLAATNPEMYSTPARAYPLLPSLVPLWAALSLGSWHEAWVNLPVIAAGIGLCLALAGLLRQAGVGALGAAIGVYLLVSTPLLGVHLSLGGYGDIWMAAYAGLGMAALLAGLVDDRRPLVVLGLLLLVLGLGVKVEGWVWLVAGITVWALARLPGRWLAVTAVVLAAGSLVAALTGWTVFDVPGLGRIGYRDGLLYVPVKGVITLQRHAVAEAYRINAFQLGSWHLLWFMMLALAGVLLAAWRSRLARVAAAFLVVFVSLQVVIFVFTTEGAWARDYTAINRMPLQMLPALLFLLVLGADRALRLAPPVQAKTWALAGTGAVLFVIGGAVAWLSVQPAGDPAEPREFDGGELRLVAGRGQTSEDRIDIEAFQDGIALLSSGPVQIDPERWRLLRVALDASIDLEQPEAAPAFFWRRADQPREVSRVTLTRSGLLELSANPAWRGSIVEVGFLFVDSGEGLPALESARLESETLANQLALAADQWTTAQPWTQQSAHFVTGGAADPRLSLTTLVGLAVFGAALLGLALAGRAAAPVVLAGLLLAGWVVMDSRWLWERSMQAASSLSALREAPIDVRRTQGEMGRFTGFIDTLLAQHLPAGPNRVLIVRDFRLDRFYGLRSKYDLLPHSSIVRPRLPPATRLATVDYVLFLGPFTDGDPSRLALESPRQRWSRLGLADREDAQALLQRVHQDDHGVLFRVRR